MGSKVYMEDTSIAGRRAEIDIKVERIVRLLENEGLEALYLARQANFAWITAGGSGVVGSNQIATRPHGGWLR